MKDLTFFNELTTNGQELIFGGGKYQGQQQKPIYIQHSLTCTASIPSYCSDGTIIGENIFESLFLK
jgi:hypothetical protein